MGKVRRKRVKYSPLWSYFSVVNSEKSLAKCDLCGLQMSYRGTITNFNGHLKKKHLINVKTDQRENKPDGNSNLNDEIDPIKLDEDPLSEPNTSTNIESNNDTSVEAVPTEPVENSVTTTPPSIPSFLGKTITAGQKENIDKFLINLFIEDFEPFTIIENSNFRAFIKELNPSYDIPSRKDVTDNILPALYKECHNVIFKKVQEAASVCLTTECWLSCIKESYLAVTCHFINDNFQLESVFLDCLVIEESYTGSKLASEIKKITDRFNLTNKVFILVSDNAYNVSKVAEVLNSAIDRLQWKHFSCFALTLNLAVQDALKTVQPLVEKGRHIVNFFKRSSIATERLLKFQSDSGVSDPKKLKRGDTTRWNSIYFMLSRLTLLRDAVKTSLALSERDDLSYSYEEWKVCSEIVKVLKPFQEVAKKMSEEGYVFGSQVIVLTSGLIHVCTLLQKQPYQAVVLKMVAELHKGLSNRFSNIEVQRNTAICTFIDPRFKMYPFTSEHAKVNAKKVVTELAVKEYNKTTICHENRGRDKHDEKDGQDDELSIWSRFDGIVGNDKASGNNKKDKQSMDNDEQSDKFSIWSRFDGIIAKEKKHQENATSDAIIEIDCYLQNAALDRKEDPLKWWAKNHYAYPTLSEVVKQRFSMVATSVSCERVFSKTGIVLNDKRTRLKPSKLQLLLFLNGNKKYMQ